MGRCIQEINKQMIIRLKEYISNEDMKRVRDLPHRFFLSPNVFKVLEKLEIVQSVDAKRMNVIIVKYEGIFYVATKCCDTANVLFSSDDEIVLDEEDADNNLSFCNIKADGESEFDKEINQGDLVIAIKYLLFIKGFLEINADSFCLFSNFFDWDEIQEFAPSYLFPYFTECRIFSLGEREETIYKEDLERWSIQLSILERKTQFNFDAEEDYLQAAFDFLSVDASRCVIDIVRDAVLMDNPQSVYLQFFRTLEYLFILRRGVSVSSKYVKLDRDELIKHYSKDGFWEREDESVKRLISEHASKATKEEYIDYLCSVGIINSEDMEKDEYILFLKEKGKNQEVKQRLYEKEENKLVEYVYGIRNIIAHYKFGQSEIRDEQSLKKSIKCLVRMITSIYSDMGNVIEDIHKNTNTWHIAELSMQ